VTGNVMEYAVMNTSSYDESGKTYCNDVRR
jgi:hypothetical protein